MDESMTTFAEPAVDELVDQLRQRGVTAVMGTFVDNAGVARAKQVPLSRLAAFHRSGLGASYSWATFCVDDHLPLNEYFSVVGDMRMKADLSALRILDGGLAWVPLNIFDQDGTPLSHCARGALARQVGALGDAGLAGRAAFEIEFTYFDAASGQVGSGPAYGLRAMMDNEAFFADIVSALDVAGIAVEQIHAEAGLGQIELSTPPVDPVAAADVLVVTRLILCRVARRHAKLLSFAPQSLDEGIGNGAHVHFSLTRDGQPLFSGGDRVRELTPEGAQAIGGLLRWLPESLGVLAPSLLSKARLQPGKWSGAWVCWGVENREAAVRLCQATPGNPHGANVEIKVTDHSANPYAALAVVLGLALRGIREAVVLPREASGDPSTERGDDAARPFTTDQAANLRASCESPALRDILGVQMLDAISAVRGHEVDLAARLSHEELVHAFRYAWSS